MKQRTITLSPHQMPSTTNGVLRKADALQVRRVAPSTAGPFAREQPTQNTQFRFRVTKGIVVDNAKMPSNMDFTSMVMLQVPAEDKPEVSE